MLIKNYLTTLKEKKTKKNNQRLVLRLFFIVLSLGIIAAIVAVAYEMHTSRFQARELSRYAATLTYSLEPGKSDAIIYPNSGPFDTRLGYAQIPQLLNWAQAFGMEVELQTRFSPNLMQYASSGYYTPYSEKAQAGLDIKDSEDNIIFSSPYPKRIYSVYDSIPSIVVQSLLFIENRELLDTTRPFINPAVDWGRFTKAVMHEAGKYAGLNYNTIGGSTLATQIEKYRHSAGGITTDPQEKLSQMISASIRIYQNGPYTYPARQAVVLSYLNTVPLSGAPGYGEVHGLGDGLWIWFGANFNQVNQLLSLSNLKGDSLRMQGLALRQVISLMVAQRRPSYYLSSEGSPKLSKLSESYLRLLTNNGYIRPELRDAGLSQEVTLRDFSNNSNQQAFKTDKGVLMARNHLSEMLNKPLYDLDRLDLSATTTLQNKLQEQVTFYLSHLNDPAFANQAGILGDKLLTPGKTGEVQYSFTLFERTPIGNLVRVQTDNTNLPFDLNESSKLELGSTAKLRVFVTYLEVTDEIYKRYAHHSKQELRTALESPQDNLTRWVLKYLTKTKDRDLSKLLNTALERRYSANPHETFFTGSGLHTFHNYQKEDNRLNPTVREALLGSINLPFIRLMRDLAHYSSYQTTGDIAKLLADESDPRRKEYLLRFADHEGKEFLLRFWNKYKGKVADERFNILLDDLRQDAVRLSTTHRYLYPETDSVSFARFLQERLPNKKLSTKRVMELYHRYGPDAYNLSDQGYIARVHPLELWLLSYMRQHPEAEWADVVEDGQEARREVYRWLFRTRFKHARDSRIRTMLEIDAFQDIHKRWERHGYPFNQLVPSLATALGSSGDRPQALAELMGIIVNNGVRKRTLRIEKLHFATNTPYETTLKWSSADGEQVMEPAVAIIAREVLSEVIDKGTARRLREGFTSANGEPLLTGGKTGTGDNQIVTLSSRGHRLASRSINRTATFVFFLGDNHFGSITAYVPGREAADFSFTSSLPIQVLRSMAPILEPYLEPHVNVKSIDTLQLLQVSEQSLF